MTQSTNWKHRLSSENVVTRYATLAIETNGIDPSQNQTVAIGIGLFDELNQQDSVDVLTIGGALGDEQTLIRRAFDRINQFDPAALVTYNGTAFDLDYLQERISQLQFNTPPEISCDDHHIDLFLPRKQQASEAGEKWPTIEEVLDHHGITVQSTEWRGGYVTNTVFRERLAPVYLKAIKQGNRDSVKKLDFAIHNYTATDVQANISLYEADVGRR